MHASAPCRNRAERILRRRTIAGIAKALQPDLYHVHEPELLGPVLSVAGSTPVIWDANKSYLDILMDREWIPKLVRPLGRWLWDRRERQLLNKCSGVIAATEAVAGRYRSLHNNVIVIANYPSLSDHKLDGIPVRDGKTCVFTGGFNPNRGVHQVLLALAILKKRGFVVSLVLAGGDNAHLRELLKEAQEEGIQDQIEYLGALPREETTRVQLRSSIGLIPHYLRQQSRRVAGEND